MSFRPTPSSLAQATSPTERAKAVFAGLTRTFEAGTTLPLDFRRGQLARLAEGVRTRAADVETALTRDLGRPPLESVQTEVLSLLADLAFAESNLDQWTADETVQTPSSSGPAVTSKVVKQPRGPALIIAPWNFPVRLALAPLIGAIAAGAPAVVKPSEIAPASSSLVTGLVKSFLDPAAYVVVEGGAAETKALLDMPWSVVFYTGGTAVGREVYQSAAKNLASVVLELGGKSPVYVHSDADLVVAAKRVVAAKLINAGQMCVAPDYVLVHASVKDAFVKEVLSALDKFLGTDPRQSKSLGRLVNHHHFDRVVRLLSDTHRGTVVCGGLDKFAREEKYAAPTVVLEPHLGSKLMREEIFAPLLPVISVQSLAHAIGVINAREHSLASYVFTADETVVTKFVRETLSGGTCWNDCVAHLANPHLPFGGVGGSGLGAYHGRASFDAFTHRRALLAKPFTPDNKLYPPHSDKVLKMMRSMI